MRNRQIIRLESISATLIHPTATDDQEQQPILRPDNKGPFLFFFFSSLLRPINSLIGCGPNWRRPGHLFRLLIQVTLIQWEQSGPHARCRVRQWPSEAPACKAEEDKWNPNNRTTPGLGNLSPCGCSRRQRSMHRVHPPPTPHGE